MAESLARAEQLLSRLIRQPGGVQDALREDASGELSRDLAALIRSDPGRPAALRLSVYADGYFARIHDCLADGFPALVEAVGASWFHDAIQLYLIAHPSRHASISYVGEALGEFLARHPDAEPVRRRFPWSGELASLEWALQQAFEATDAPLLRREALASLDPEQWADLALRAHPSVRLLRFEWPVAELRRAFEREESIDIDSESLRGDPQVVLVWREGDLPVYRTVDSAEAGALERVLGAAPGSGDASFGSLCEWAAEVVGESEAPARAAGWLAQWVDAGCLAEGRGRRESRT